MSIITGQKDAQSRRERVRFCYLCGSDLRGSALTTEHVVPKAALGAPDCPSPWPVVLDVHQQCEEMSKRSNDALFALWRNLWLPPTEIQERANQAWDELLNTLQAELDQK